MERWFGENQNPELRHAAPVLQQVVAMAVLLHGY